MQPDAPAPSAAPVTKIKMTPRAKIVMVLAGATVIVVGLGWKLLPPEGQETFLNFAAGNFKKQCFPHSFGESCEFRARDAGETCVSDPECSKGICLYPSARDSQLLGGLGIRSAGNAASGTCDAFVGDNDGVTTCHRSEPSEPVRCSLDIS